MHVIELSSLVTYLGSSSVSEVLTLERVKPHLLYGGFTYFPGKDRFPSLLVMKIEGVRKGLFRGVLGSQWTRERRVSSFGT